MKLTGWVYKFNCNCECVWSPPSRSDHERVLLIGGRGTSSTETTSRKTSRHYCSLSAVLAGS